MANSIQLVKKIQGYSDWQAIAYLEKLATSPLTEAKEKAVSQETPGQAANSSATLPVQSEAEASPTIPSVPVAGVQNPDWPAMRPQQTLALEQSIDEHPANLPEQSAALEQSHAKSVPVAEETSAQKPGQNKANRTSSLIPQEEIDRINDEADLVALIEAKGVKLKKVGKELQGLCPLHNDYKTPSLSIDPAKKMWHCFGCGKGGRAIQWVMDTQGVGFRHACEILRGQHPLLISSPTVAKTTAKKQPLCPPESSVDYQQLMQQVMEYYHNTLLKTPPALEYLKKRGILDQEAVDKFRIGFSNRSLGSRIPGRDHKAGEEMRKKLQAIGILGDTGREHFTGCIVFPIADEHGKVTCVYGRRICEQSHSPKHLYLKGTHQGIWNPSSLISQELILDEKIIGALSWWVTGFRNVTASFGAFGFTDEMLTAFKSKGVELVYLSFDPDDAGNEGARKAADRLISQKIACKRVIFPSAMDTNDCILKFQPAHDYLANLLKNAAYLGNGKTLISFANAEEEQKAAEEENSEPESPEQDFSSLAATEEEIATNPGESINPVEPMAAKEKNIEQPKERDFSPLATTEEENVGKSQSHTESINPVNSGGDSQRAILPFRKCGKDGEDLEIVIEDRKYRVRGLAKNQSYDILKINLQVFRGEKYHVDTLDLYQARQRAWFIKAASQEIGIHHSIIQHDLGRLLLTLEGLQDRMINKTLAVETPVIKMSLREEEEARAYLKAPHLLERIADDYEFCGLVGERSNTKVGHLACITCEFDEPLGTIIQSLSAAGKSTLLNALLKFQPPEKVIKYTALTGQSLFYMEEKSLKHKILAIIEEKGAEKATYAIKILQSEGNLTIASAGKDPKSGRHITNDYHVEGPAHVLLATTAAELDDEFQNRGIVLTMNEKREQCHRFCVQ
jgi:DNA primase catalytic core